VLGQHFNSTLENSQLVPVRVYLNQGLTGPDPTFTDITTTAGMPGLPTKAPHVEFQDFDNDGWLDILTTASAGNGTLPAIFRNTGTTSPAFETPPGIGDPQYWVTGPTADYDRNGTLDIMLIEWFPSLPSILLSNGTQGGNWLDVEACTAEGSGIGTRVDVYEAGGLGNTGSLIGSREITATQGYTAGVESRVRFGLDTRATVDVRVSRHGQVVNSSGISANQAVTIGC